MILFRANQISCKSASHACMNEHFLQKIYLADTPHRGNTSCFRGCSERFCSYLDVFPKPQSNTTETFTPFEIAFFFEILSLYENTICLSKCLNSRIFRYLSFGVMSHTPHASYEKTDQMPATS